MSGLFRFIGAPLSTLAALLAIVGSSPAPARAATPNSLTLDWTASGDDGTTGRATFYVLKYSTTDPGSTSLDSWWNNQGTQQASGVPTPAPSGNPETFDVIGLTPSTQYYFVIRAVDDAGLISDYSNIASGSTLPCDAPTEAPQALQVSVDSGDALLSWDATSDPLAESIHIYRATTGQFQLLTTLDPSNLTYRDTSVNPGVTYRYRAAWAASCGDGPSTSEVSVTMPGTPSSPGAASVMPELHAYPNPSSGPVDFVVTVRTASAQPARVRLFDLTGRWIADILDGSYAPGDTRVTWPRTDRAGRAVAPGYYEVIGTVGSERVRERIVLLP